MRTAPRAGWCVLLAAALVVPLPLRATMVVAKSFAALCAEAEVVFVGTVADMQSRWAGPDQREIETLITFSDLMPLLGAEEPEVTLRFAGGEMDGLREEVAGIPRFTIGERVVIFARGGHFVSPIIGFHQGCFRVVDGPDDPVVVNCERHAVAVIEDGVLQLGGAEAARGAPVTLDNFMQRVRRELEARSGGKQ